MAALIRMDVPIYICESIYIGNYSYYPDTNTYYWESSVTGMSWSANDTTYDERAEHLAQIY